MPSVAQIGSDEVPLPGFGLMGLSAFYDRSTADDALTVLKKAYDIGCRFWDTADVYSRPNTHGDNEKLIAAALKKYDIPRKDLFICTKFAGSFTDTGMTINGSPEYAKLALDRSLKNLELDYVDLYYLHRVDPNVPIEESAKALEELRQAGKTRYIGISECTSDQLRRACKVAKIDAVQREYSLFDTTAEDTGVYEACKELGIAFVAYSPLSRGFLSGTIRSPEDFGEADFRKYLPRFSEENFGYNLDLVQQISAIANKKGITPAQLALAWTIKKGTLPIPGTTKVKRLEENFAAGDVGISQEEFDVLADILKKFPVRGDRYSTMSGVDK